MTQLDPSKTYSNLLKSDTELSLQRIRAINSWPDLRTKSDIEYAVQQVQNLERSSISEFPSNVSSILGIIQKIDVLDDESVPMMQLSIALRKLEKSLSKIAETTERNCRNYSQVDSNIYALPPEHVDQMIYNLKKSSELLDNIVVRSAADENSVQKKLTNYFVEQVEIKFEIGWCLVKFGELTGYSDLVRWIGPVSELTAKYAGTINARISKAGTLLKEAVADLSKHIVSFTKYVLDIIASNNRSSVKQTSLSERDASALYQYLIDHRGQILVAVPADFSTSPDLRTCDLLIEQYVRLASLDRRATRVFFAGGLTNSRISDYFEQRKSIASGRSEYRLWRLNKEYLVPLLAANT